MVVAGVHALFRLPLSMLGLAASLLLPEGQAPKAPASEPSKDVRQANLELERGYAQHVQELTMEIKRQKTAKRDYQAKYLAAMECNKLLQQQLEALVHGGGSKGSTDSASAAGPPGASSSGSSAWALHGSALGAALLLRWVTYSHGDHHQNLAHRMLEDKALMVFAWPAIWAYVLLVINRLPNTALSRRIVTFAAWVLIGWALHEVFDSRAAAAGGGAAYGAATMSPSAAAAAAAGQCHLASAGMTGAAAAAARRHY